VWSESKIPHARLPIASCREPRRQAIEVLRSAQARCGIGASCGTGALLATTRLDREVKYALRDDQPSCATLRDNDTPRGCEERRTRPLGSRSHLEQRLARDMDPQVNHPSLATDFYFREIANDNSRWPRCCGVIR
jgi:hypothetical protein